MAVVGTSVTRSANAGVITVLPGFEVVLSERVLAAGARNGVDPDAAFHGPVSDVWRALQQLTQTAAMLPRRFEVTVAAVGPSTPFSASVYNTWFVACPHHCLRPFAVTLPIAALLADSGKGLRPLVSKFNDALSDGFYVSYEDLLKGLDSGRVIPQRMAAPCPISVFEDPKCLVEIWNEKHENGSHHLHARPIFNGALQSLESLLYAQPSQHCRFAINLYGDAIFPANYDDNNAMLIVIDTVIDEDLIVAGFHQHLKGTRFQFVLPFTDGELPETVVTGQNQPSRKKIKDELSRRTKAAIKSVRHETTKRTEEVQGEIPVSQESTNVVAYGKHPGNGGPKVVAAKPLGFGWFGSWGIFDWDVLESTLEY